MIEALGHVGAAELRDRGSQHAPYQPAALLLLGRDTSAMPQLVHLIFSLYIHMHDTQTHTQTHTHTHTHTNKYIRIYVCIIFFIFFIIYITFMLVPSFK